MVRKCPVLVSEPGKAAVLKLKLSDTFIGYASDNLFYLNHTVSFIPILDGEHTHP